MKLDDVQRIMRDAVDALIAAGVSRPAAEKAMTDAEVVAVDDLIETQRDRRLLEIFDSIGSARLAERRGESQRTVCRKRQEAADRLYRKQIGQPMVSDVSGKAA